MLAGATYGGTIKHCAINYALVAAGVALHTVPACVDRRGAGRWLALLAAIALVQVLLWFVADAQGVSLIWSALYGHAFGAGSERRPGRRSVPQNRWRLGLLALGIWGLLYYAVTLPPVTTLAHLLAVALGALWR